MSQVKPIPEGMHTVTPHLICKGCVEALAFYQKAFGAEEVHRMMSPDGKAVMHAQMRIGDSAVMLADEMPEWQAKGPGMLGGSPVVLHLYVTDVDAFVDKAAAAGAKVTMPVQDTFWGDRYGKLEDPYGHQWSVATHTRDVTPEEMEKAAKEMFGG